jgi:hypothetical protein
VSSSNLAWLRRVGVAIGLCSLAFTACQYDVPITSGPTRKVEEQLLGDWSSADGKEKLKVRRLEDNTYVLYYDGDLFRAYHGHRGQTVRHGLGSQLERSQVCLHRLEIMENGKSLSLRNVNDKVVPKETKDSPTVVALLTKNARNPELFGEKIEFRKEK